MNVYSRLYSLLTVLVVSLLLSASAAWAEDASTPTSVAEGFTKAYYMLDADMARYMSADAVTNEDDVNLVTLFLRLKAEEAQNRGYQPSYLKMFPVLMKAHVVEETEDTATVEVQTTALRCINPFYRAMGYLFGLLKEHEFDTTLELVKEDGTWKVGPGALGLAG